MSRDLLLLLFAFPNGGIDRYFHILVRPIDQEDDESPVLRCDELKTTPSHVFGEEVMRGPVIVILIAPSVKATRRKSLRQ